MKSPHRYVFFFSFAAISSLSATVALAGPSSTAVPLDSFINQHVSTLPQLTQQVTMDPVVRRRLALHFHTSGPAMVRYIQENLVLRKTTVAKRYTVWCISRNGHEYMVSQHIPVGTPIFVSKRTGQPVLKLACGNPMVASLPPVIKTSPSQQEAPRLATVPPAPRPPAQPALAQGAPVIVATTTGVEITPVPVVRVAESLPFLRTIGHGGSPLGFLAGIPILAGIFSNGSHNNSDTPPGITGTPVPPVPPGNTGGPAPVPEPSTTISFAIGVALLVLSGRRRNRKPQA